MFVVKLGSYLVVFGFDFYGILGISYQCCFFLGIGFDQLVFVVGFVNVFGMFIGWGYFYLLVLYFCVINCGVEENVVVVVCFLQEFKGKYKVVVEFSSVKVVVLFIWIIFRNQQAFFDVLFFGIVGFLVVKVFFVKKLLLGVKVE